MSVGLLATSCGGMTSGYPSVDGDYLRYGAYVSFLDTDEGQNHYFSPITLEESMTDLTTQGEQLYLNLNDCFDIEVRRSGSNGHILTAGPHECPLFSDAMVTRTLVALRIDLDQKTIHWQYCQQQDRDSHCRSEDGVFVPREDFDFAGVQAEETTSEVLWDYGEDASLLMCGEYDEIPTECIPGPAPGVESVGGTVHQLEDGSLYLDGFDCLVPPGYDGERILCGQSLVDLGSASLPELWVTRFLIEDEHLSFQAELVGAQQSSVHLEAPLRRH